MIKNKICNKKTLTKFLLVGIILLICSNLCGKSDRYLKSRVMKLEGPRGMCSGEQVRAPSGVDYILTAAHCAPIAVDGQIMVTTEDGRKLNRRIIAEDDSSDLLLLEGIPNMRGLDIARHSQHMQQVRTFTHGGRMNTWKSKGTLMDTISVDILLEEIMSNEDAAACSKPKNRQVDYFGHNLCLLHVYEDVSDALSIPGSSGGMVVDNDGDLVGVVSAGGNGLSLFVRLSDIRIFLGNY